MTYCDRCNNPIEAQEEKPCKNCREQLQQNVYVADLADNKYDFDEMLANLNELEKNEQPFAVIFDVNAAYYAGCPIDEVVLPVRVVKRLKQIGVITIDQLLNICPANLMALGYFGKNSLILVVKYLAKVIASHKQKEYIENWNQVVSVLSREEIQFIVENCERFKRKEYTVLKEENRDTKNLTRLINLFENIHTLVDYTKLYSVLTNPEKVCHVREIIDKTLEQIEEQAVLRQALEKLPIYKRGNHASFYLAAYECPSLDRSVLEEIYESPDSTLDSVLTHFPDHKEDIDIVCHFLEWCAFDVASEIKAFMDLLFSKDRTRKVIKYHAEGMNFKEIGDLYGLTRERIRQIELKAVIQFNKFQNNNKLIPKICADRNGDTVLTVAEISDYCGEYTVEIIHLLKTCDCPDYRYSDRIGVFVVDSDGTEEGRVKKYVDDLPEAFDKKYMDEILKDAVNNRGLSEELLGKYIEKDYIRHGDRYLRVKLNKQSMYKHIMAKYYSDGIRVYDDGQLNQFKEYFYQEFGDAEMASNKALSARLADLGLLCDRGTYKLRQKKYISEKLANEIETFIKNNKAPIMPVSYVYNHFKEKLKAERVGNYYYLHGILTEMFSEQFYVHRLYVSPRKEGYDIYGTIQKAIKEADKPINQKDLECIIPGISPITVSVAAESPEVLKYWGAYFYCEKARISVIERKAIEELLQNVLADSVPHDSWEIYEKISMEYPSVLSNNYVYDQFSCFSLLKYWFKDVFQFIRPYIALKNVRIEKASERLHNFVYSKDEITIDEIATILKELGYENVSQLNYAKRLNDKFFMVTNMKLVSIDKLGIDEHVAKKVESIVLPYVTGTMKIRDLTCFQKLPKIKCEWTDWLLYSVFRKWSSKLSVGESYNQIRLAVPLIAKAGEYDTSVVFYDSKQQTSFTTNNLENMDELLEDIIEWDDLDV